MLSFLPGPIIGVLSALIMSANIFLMGLIFFPVVAAKLLIPIPAWQRLCSRTLDWIATVWVANNGLGLELTKKLRWEVEGLEGLTPVGWYLLLANHQTWADIVLLQRIFNRKIPFIKFFLKKELIWAPVMGQAWWALDFPFVRRYSEAFLKKHPHLRGKDMEITRKACEKFKKIPITVMNFPEGTRFSPQKHDRQKSPHTHLLKPKAGGIAFVLTSMGNQFTCILDVTIHYPNGAPTFFQFLCERESHIQVRIRRIPVTKDLIGDYSGDEKFRAHFQDWLNGLWRDKDRLLAELAAGSERPEAAKDKLASRHAATPDQVP